MAWRKMLVLMFLLSTLGVSSAFAQHEFEVAPFGGTKFGGTIDFTNSIQTPSNPNVDYYTIKSSVDYGILADYTLFSSIPSLQLEFMWNHQPTDLDQHIYQTNTKEFLTSADLDQYEWGFSYTLRDPSKHIRPYIVGGLGFTHFSSGGYLPFTNTFAYNLGGGAKYFFNSHIGLRLEARWAPSRTTTGIQEVLTPFGVETFGVSNHAQQGEANLGLIFRFGKTSS
jgi:opacity protein-like surface antigen